MHPSLLLTTVRTVVASFCIGLAETINKLGPAFIENSKSACNIRHSLANTS